MKKKADLGVFGDPSYLTHKFDDIIDARWSERSNAANEIRSIVGSMATKKDKMCVLSVVKTETYGPGGSGFGVVAKIVIGLNGHGRETDYLAALKRVIGTGKFHVIDAQIDAVDDLWYFLLSYEK